MSFVDVILKSNELVKDDIQSEKIRVKEIITDIYKGNIIFKELDIQMDTQSIKDSDIDRDIQLIKDKGSHMHKSKGTLPTDEWSIVLDNYKNL